MRFNPLSATVLVGSLATLACNPAPPSEPERGTSAEIIGGSVDTGDPAVVQVLAVDSASHENGFCTGTVITPVVVLTASHCVDPGSLGFTPTDYGISIATDLNQRQPSDLIRAAKAIAHPAYDRASGANDVAALVFDAPLGIAPLPYNRTPLDAYLGATARIVGYGITSDKGTDATVKHSATVQLMDVTADTIYPVTTTATACHGDSGGPTLLNMGGRDTVIATGWRTVDPTGSCLQGVNYLRVDKHIDFIDAVVQAADGGAAPQPAPAPAPPPAPAPAPPPAPAPAPVPPPPPAPGGGDGAPRIAFDGHCCYGGNYYECTSTAACFGGFDVNACLAKCSGPTDPCFDECFAKQDAAGPPVACAANVPAPPGIDCATGQINVSQ